MSMAIIPTKLKLYALDRMGGLPKCVGRINYVEDESLASLKV